MLKPKNTCIACILINENTCMDEEAGCSRMISPEMNQCLRDAMEAAIAKKNTLALDLLLFSYHWECRGFSPQLPWHFQGFPASSSCRVDRSSRRVLNCRLKILSLDSKIKYRIYPDIHLRLVKYKIPKNRNSQFMLTNKFQTHCLPSHWKTINNDLPRHMEGFCLQPSPAKRQRCDPLRSCLCSNCNKPQAKSIPNMPTSAWIPVSDCFFFRTGSGVVWPMPLPFQLSENRGSAHLRSCQCSPGLYIQRLPRGRCCGSTWSWP